MYNIIIKDTYLTELVIEQITLATKQCNHKEMPVIKRADRLYIDINKLWQWFKNNVPAVSMMPGASVTGLTLHNVLAPFITSKNEIMIDYDNKFMGVALKMDLFGYVYYVQTGKKLRSLSEYLDNEEETFLMRD